MTEIRKNRHTKSMALRVLLADESATIKKVMQITLQDFGVEIRSVNLGTDVADVAKSFQPDIIFVDILLQKKSGYEVASELRAAPNTANTPIIMLWNAFMGFDEQKYAESGATDKIEKPFDSEALRNVILKYVPSMQSNPIAAHLDVPEINWDEEPTQIPAEQDMAQEPALQEEPKEEMNWSMDQFEDLPSAESLLEEDDSEDDAFQPRKLDEVSASSDSASSPSLSKYTLDIPKEELGEFEMDGEEDPIEIDDSSIMWGNTIDESVEKKVDTAAQEKPAAPAQSASPTKQRSENSDIQANEVPQEARPEIPDSYPDTATNTKIAPSPQMNQGQNSPVANLSEAEIEAYVREHCQDVIERLARELVPQYAKDLIQKEIDRLVAEEADS